jgi:Glycosyltransferase family 87
MTGRRVLTVVAIACVATAFYYARIRHEMIDFETWRVSAVRALDAAPLYRIEDGHYQFKYLPLFALAMAPFGLLAENTGKPIWFAASIVMLAIILRASVTALPDRRLPQPALVWLTILLMAKFYAHELVLGQTNVLLGLLLAGALVAARWDRPLTAGAFAGAAVFVKPYALILFPWLLVTQGWRSAAAATGLVAAGLLLPAVVYGWDGNLDLLRGWFQTVAESTTPNLLGSDNVSFAAMWAKWLGPGPLASALAVITIVGALLLVVMVLRTRRAVAAPAYLECALLMLLMPLISPQGWDYVLLLATPAIVCVIDRWRELTTPWQWTLGVALALMAFSMFDVMGRELYGRFMALSAITLCALAIAIGLVHLRQQKIA